MNGYFVTVKHMDTRDLITIAGFAEKGSAQRFADSQEKAGYWVSIWAGWRFYKTS